MINSENIASAVICYHPDLNELKQLLTNLASHTGQVVVVNNGGMSDFIDLIRAISHKITIISPAQNIGVAAGLNSAFETAALAGYEYVISFDQDSVIDGSALLILIDEFNFLQNSGQKIGAIGPRFFDPRLTDRVPDLKSADPVRRQFVISSGCLASVAMWRQSARFNELLFIDLVDVSWCWELEMAGFHVYQSQKAVMTHQLSEGMKAIFGGRFLNRYSPLRRYYLARNSIYLMLYQFGGWTKTRYLLRALAFSILSAAFADRKKWRSIGMILKGIGHGIVKRMGPGS